MEMKEKRGEKVPTHNLPRPWFVSFMAQQAGKHKAALRSEDSQERQEALRSQSDLIFILENADVHYINSESMKWREIQWTYVQVTVICEPKGLRVSLREVQGLTQVQAEISSCVWGLLTGPQNTATSPRVDKCGLSHRITTETSKYALHGNVINSIQVVLMI